METVLTELQPPLLPLLAHWKLLEYERVNLSYGGAFTRETDVSRNPQTLYN